MKKNNIYKIFLTVSLMLSGFGAFAQSSISGVVKDNKGETVIGAAVVLDGNNSVAAVTDIDGKYTITLPQAVKNPTFTVSCLGYKTLQVALGKSSVLDITLEIDTEELEEVVVVGYGMMRKSDITGSVASVRIDHLEAAQSNTIDQLLRGNAAGVNVTANNAGPDAGVTINVRGMGSFNGSNEPLYVVDGIILNNPTQNESVLTIGTDNEDTDETVNGLMGINPQDIESLEILKDASATAIYGALGANGVVLITTKTATKERPTINFNAGIDISTKYKKMDILSFDEYVTYLEKQKAAGISTDSLLKGIYEDPSTHTGLLVTPVDWQDYAFQTAVSQRYYLSITGRPKTLSYAFSVGYNDKMGIVKTTGVKNITMRLNLEKQFGKHIRVGTKSNIAYIDSKQGQSAGKATAATSLIRSILSYRPYTKFNDDEEERETEELDAGSSPSRWLTDFVNDRKEVRITPSVYLQAKFLDGFSFKSTFGGDYRNSNRTKFKSSRINSTSEGSTGAIATFRYVNWNWDNTLQYLYKKRGHNVNAMIGTSANSSNLYNENVQGWNIVQYNGLAASIPTAPNSSKAYYENKSTTLSFFARAVYSWKDRYVFTGTWRLDGSSKFQGNNKWANFPSAAFAWRMNEEPWFNSAVISQTKFRLGWGRVGNQAISSYQTMSNYGNTTYADHSVLNPSGYSVGIVPTNIANPDLKWETTEQANFGFDFALWQGRLAFTLDLYNKMTYDLLQLKNIPTSSGFATMYVNEGTVRNRGIEFTLDTTPIKTNGWEWRIDGNISMNKNCIMGISETASKGKIYLDETTQIDAVYFTGSSVGSSTYASSPLGIFIVGHEMGLFYGYKTAGIIQEGETGPALVKGGQPSQPGHVRYVDTNGNGYIDTDDRMIVGNPNPKFIYGFSTTLSYKGLSLRAAFDGKYGGDIINVNNIRETDTGQKNHNVLRAAVYDSWSTENTGARYWAIGSMTSTETRYVKDIDIEDGSYLRMSTLSLSYRIPISKDSKVLKGMNVGFTGSNLVVWTKYSGWDPEVNSFGNNVMKMGADAGSYPSARTFSFDVNFTF